MLLVLVLIHQISVIFSNPYNNYPFAHLLNVGNPDLYYTKTQEARVTVPGGLVFLRYPVQGYGDIISNVRVDTIDNDKNFIVKIVEGGPGFNHVVLTLLGESEVPYVVLVTLQTIPFTKTLFENIPTNVDNKIDEIWAKLDRNDNAENKNKNVVLNAERRTRINAEMNEFNSAAAGSEQSSEKYNDDFDDDNESSEFEAEINKNEMDDDSDDHDSDDIAYAEDEHKSTTEKTFDKSTVEADNIVDESKKNKDIFLGNDKYSDESYDEDTEAKVESNLFKTYESEGLQFDNEVEQKDNLDDDYNEQSDKSEFGDSVEEIDQEPNNEGDRNYSEYNKYNNFDSDDTYAFEY